MVHKYIHKSILLMPAKNCIFGGNCSLKKCILRTLVSLQDTRNSYYCPTPKSIIFMNTTSPQTPHIKLRENFSDWDWPLEF